MFVLDADEGHGDEDEFEYEEDVRADVFWREVRAREQVAAVAGAPAMVRWLAWLRRMWWRVDPQIHVARLQLRLARWRERVDWPLVRTGLFAFARAFLLMMLLVLREVDYHFLPQLKYPFELPRDSYVLRLQASVRFCMLGIFRLLCALYGFSGVITVLVGLRIDIGTWQKWDTEDQGLEPVADLPETVIPIGAGQGILIRGQIHWVPLLVVMVLMVAVVFLINPVAQEPLST